MISPKGVVSTALTQPFARVGTHADSEIVLADGPLNGRSLYLHAIRGGVFCLDLRRVEGDSTGHGFWLQPTDEVGIGRHWLRAKLQGPTPPGTPQTKLDLPESATYPRPVLEIVSAKRRIAKKRLQSSLSTVGRWPQCGLHLQGQLVSGVHCALYWNDGRLWCIDLLSSNRTLYREEPVSCVELTMGERIEIGEFAIVFERLSRQMPAKSKSKPNQPRSTSSPRTGSATKSLKNAWRESESGPAENSGPDLSATILTRHSDSQASRLVAASDSAISLGSQTDVNQAQLQEKASSNHEESNHTGQLTELQQLEDLREKLHGQFAQIQAEANQLAELTQRLNSASLQWSENRAEIIRLLASSLSPPVLAGRPPSTTAFANCESHAPKAIVPALTTPSSAVASNSPSSSTLTAVSAISSPAPSDELRVTGTLPRLASAAAPQGQAATNGDQRTKEADPAANAPEPRVSRPLPIGRGTRRTSVKRNELDDFVSDRIALIERQRQQKKLLIGLGVIAATLLIIGIAGGLWYGFGPEISFGPPTVNTAPSLTHP